MIYNVCDVLLILTLEKGRIHIVDGFATYIQIIASNIRIFHEIVKDAVEMHEHYGCIHPYKWNSVLDNSYGCKGENVHKLFFKVLKKKMLGYYGILL